jgi:hypothetical protein
LFAGNYVRQLSPRLCVFLLGLALLSCGQDAEKRYAGLSTVSIALPSGGAGYLLRYLAPPWEGVDDDPQVTGMESKVPFGASQECTSSKAACLTIEAHSASVLEIERQSLVPEEDGTIVFPKYRLEAAFVRCTADMLAAKDECYAVLGRMDQVGRETDPNTDDRVFSGKSDKNDAGQPFYEFQSVTVLNQRYRRIAYFSTDDRLLAVRVFMEANPSLAEEEVTRMLHAFEIVSDQPAWDAGTSSDGGKP